MMNWWSLMADFDIKLTLSGLDSVIAKIQAVKYDMAKKGGRFALRKAAQVIRNAARENAQRVDDSETGRSIARNIAEKWNGRLNKSTGDLGFRVGVSGGAKIPKNNTDEGSGGPTPHWRLLEFGTEKMRARPFFVPAINANLQKTADVFVEQYDKALDRALKRQAKG